MIVKLGNRRYPVKLDAKGVITHVSGQSVKAWLKSGDEQMIDLLQEQVTRRILLTQVRDYVSYWPDAFSE